MSETMYKLTPEEFREIREGFTVFKEAVEFWASSHDDPIPYKEWNKVYNQLRKVFLGIDPTLETKKASRSHFGSSLQPLWFGPTPIGDPGLPWVAGDSHLPAVGANLRRFLAFPCCPSSRPSRSSIKRVFVACRISATRT